jgi:hypothetical protein
MPLPPGFTSVANLPLQLLLAERLMSMLIASANGSSLKNSKGSSSDSGSDRQYLGSSVRDVNTREPLTDALTSIVRKEDLHRAFPTSFGPWRLDRIADMTAREALCRLQGIDAFDA